MALPEHTPARVWNPRYEGGGRRSLAPRRSGRGAPGLCSADGPNLAKGDFLAKYSRSEAKTGENCHADRGAPYGALSGRKVRIMGRLRSFEHTGGSKPDERAAETG